jgi:prephenate dehydrogenase
MPTQITIIGLGQIGASMGLALAEHKQTILRVGHDKTASIEREAVKKDAVDKVEHNLPSAVRDAKIVVLSIPMGEVRETLEFINQDLQEGAIVFDTSPIKAEMVKRAQELLPKGCHYVGLSPALNPEYLHDFAVGLDAARADLFHKGLFLIDTPSGTSEQVLTLAMEFVHLLGATPLLSDAIESDGLMSTAHILPQLVSAALLNATIDQPGWLDARKLASRAYATMTSGVEYFDEVDSLRLSALQNRVGLVHALDVMSAALRGLRDDIEKGDAEGLAARLKAAQAARQQWMSERITADWENVKKAHDLDVPSFFERMFGGAIAKQLRKK